MERFRDLPADLPVPEDDGAADHLRGAGLRPVTLPATSGEEVNLADAAAGTLVLYVYPRTGVPGQPLPEGWDEIPGARGCTPQLPTFEAGGMRLSKRLTLIARGGTIAEVIYPVFPPGSDAVEAVELLR